VSLSLRSLASDTAIYGLSTIAGRFLTFLLTPFYTHYLSGPTEYGHIATIYTAIAFINIVYSFGFDTAFMRYYTHKDAEYRTRVFSNAFWGIVCISLTFTLLAIGIVSIFPVSLQGIGNSKNIIIGAALIPFLDALMIIPYALLRMERRSKRFAVTKFAIIVINVLLNILFVAMVRYGALGVIISGILSSLFGVILLSKEIRGSLTPTFDIPLAKEMIKFGLPTVPAAFSSIVLQLIDRPILGILTDPRTVGIYQANYRLGIPMMMFVSVFETAWKPFYLSNADKPEAKKIFSQVLTVFTAVCAIIFIGVVLFINDIVALPFRGTTFIHHQYWVGLHIIPYILAGYWFNGFYIQFSAGFHITKQTKYLPIAMGTAAVTTVLCNLLLVPQWGIEGSAYAMMISYFVAALFLYYFSRKIYPLSYEWKNIFLLISTALITVVFYEYMSPLSLLNKSVLFIGAFAAISIQLIQKKSILYRLKA